jgi:predicted nicotinamide N-methyase
MFDLDAFYREYDVDVKEMVIAGKSFQFATPKTIDRFIDFNEIEHDFPLWAKIWEASWILGEHVAKKNPDPMRNILEIGSGIGVVGVVASVFGHGITMTEYNEHALNFARANAEINQCPGVTITKLDWHQPSLAGRFDWIIGSEVLYNEKDFSPMLKLFERYLKPYGTITLALGVRQGGLTMMNNMRQLFNMKVKKITIRSEEQSTQVLLCNLTPKPSIKS